MHDRWIVAIALATASLGVVGLLFALIFLEVPLTPIGESQEGTLIRVKGEVANVRQQGNLTFITITEQVSLLVVSENVSVSKGDCLLVQGKKEVFRDQSQLRATKILRCA